MGSRYFSASSHPASVMDPPPARLPGAGVCRPSIMPGCEREERDPQGSGGSTGRSRRLISLERTADASR